MILIIKILQTILALSLLIVIHELGHFTFAKIFGIRVDKFFLFFDVGGVRLLSSRHGWFSKLFPGLRKYRTEYGIGWLPLGGYCKINGMIDESLDLSTLGTEPKPWEFRSKAAWKRLLVMAGGVLFNFIFAILVYISIMGIWGEYYVSNDNTPIYVSPLAEDMGFRNGDRILALDGVKPLTFNDITADIVRKDVRVVTILRGADTLQLYIDRSRISEILNQSGLFSPAIPFVVDSIPPSSPNFGGALEKGDRICGLEGESLPYLQDCRKFFPLHSGETVSASIIRGTDTLSVPLSINAEGQAQIFSQVPDIQRHIDYSAAQAIPAGLRFTSQTIGGYIKDLGLVATPSTGAYKSVGSFISIGQVFPDSWDSFSFLNILALLSIMLGVMNLLPIPGLDGGHIIFTLYEMFTGRKPSEKFLVGAQMVGMVLLVGLMILAFGNDISRLLR